MSTQSDPGQVFPSISQRHMQMPEPVGAREPPDSTTPAPRAAADPETIEHRRQADAARARASYRRRTLGIAQFKLELPLHLVIDRLIEVGLLDIAEAEKHEHLE
jgi:hypothetical protein